MSQVFGLQFTVCVSLPLSVCMHIRATCLSEKLFVLALMMMMTMMTQGSSLCNICSHRYVHSGFHDSNQKFCLVQERHVTVVLAKRQRSKVTEATVFHSSGFPGCISQTMHSKGTAICKISVIVFPLKQVVIYNDNCLAQIVHKKHMLPHWPAHTVVVIEKTEREINRGDCRLCTLQIEREKICVLIGHQPSALLFHC